MNSIVKNNNNYSFKPVMTPPKTQLKSFEIVELNENNENNVVLPTPTPSATAPTKRNSINTELGGNNCEFIKLDVQTYKNLIEDFHSTKILLYKLSSIVNDFEERVSIITRIDINTIILNVFFFLSFFYFFLKGG